MMIRCENLVKIYQQTGIDVLALQGLDLSVEKGGMIGIVGESGSGKSTLMNILGGLDRPTTGKAIVDGLDLLSLSNYQQDLFRRTKVGFLWQQTTRNLIPWLTALENIIFPMVRAQDKQNCAEKLIDLVGLKNHARHLPSELSGGEQQRVALAMTLANNPPLLLADEPTGELDADNSRAIYALLKEINCEFGTTIIIVSHDPEISVMSSAWLKFVMEKPARKSSKTGLIMAGCPKTPFSCLIQLDVFKSPATRLKDCLLETEFVLTSQKIKSSWNLSKNTVEPNL